LVVDVVLGLQYGDEGKGKVSHSLLKRNYYSHCVRFNGGCNAGHTIFHEGKKVVTHHIPAGVFFGVKSIIGNGCVIDPAKLMKEIQELESIGIDVKNNLRIAKNAHVITQSHLEEDSKDEKVGTTKTGNGPAYRDKHFRCGSRAESVSSLEPFLVDMYEELGDSSIVLMEGAQGFYLDIDWGEYPYVTSCNTGISAVIQNGVPPTAIRNVYGVIKPYETYVGAKEFQGSDQRLKMLQQLGNEFGATTGRKRQCNWINSHKLVKAVRMNDVNILIVNKMDIMEKVGEWRTLNKKLENQEKFKTHIQNIVGETQVIFSYSPEHI